MFSNSFFRVPLALSSVLLGGALLISGCGGGGGGLSTPTNTPVPNGSATPMPTSTQTGTVFSDEFNSNSLDRSKWTTLGRDMTLQRTEFGKQPDFGQDTDGTHFMRVTLDSYLPDDLTRTQGNVQFYGTEVVANSKISRGNGVEFQARMRMTNFDQKGLVGSFFMFGQKGNYGGTPPLSFDEIDHELLTNAYADASPYTWTNIYNDFRVPQEGVPNGDSYSDKTKQNGLPLPLTTGYDKTGWNVYRIVWQAGQVQWFINDQLVLTDTTGRVPDDALGVRLNLWAAKDWAAAYSDALKPATTSAENKTYSLDVDWVRVRTLDGTSNDVRSTTASRLLPLSSAEISRGLPGASYRSNAKR